MNSRKESIYQTLYGSLNNLIDPTGNWRSNWANSLALMHSELDNWWTGFYFVRGDKLELDMFQGPVACTQIAFGKGVCGTCWKEKKTQIVENVHEFPGHIACNAESNSEIVVPVFVQDKIVAVLDCDSCEFSAYNHLDALWLEKIVLLLAASYPAIE